MKKKLNKQQLLNEISWQLAQWAADEHQRRGHSVDKIDNAQEYANKAFHKKYNNDTDNYAHGGDTVRQEINLGNGNVKGRFNCVDNKNGGIKKRKDVSYQDNATLNLYGNNVRLGNEGGEEYNGTPEDGYRVMTNNSDENREDFNNFMKKYNQAQREVQDYAKSRQDMNTNKIKLTESQLKQMISETVKKVLDEASNDFYEDRFGNYREDDGHEHSIEEFIREYNNIVAEVKKVARFINWLNATDIRATDSAPRYYDQIMDEVAPLEYAVNRFLERADFRAYCEKHMPLD